MSIVFENVCKTFDGRMLFDNLNLSLKKGTLTCITGISGSGKTTFLRMLMGLEHPDSGRISGLDNTVVSAVFQEDRLCPALSASANAAIALKKGKDRRYSDGILRSLGLGDDLNKPASVMSGGMRRRIAIARALSADYDLLLLDEPFTGLDVANRNCALACILDNARNRTVIIVTHDPDIPALAGGDLLDFKSPSAATNVK